MTDQKLVEQAFAMHQFSYAPYSKFPVGAAPRAARRSWGWDA